MDATANTIWSVPAYLPYLQPPLTGMAIAEAEQQIGHELPQAYLDLLRAQNGGYIRFTLPDLDAEHRVIAGIGPNFPSLTGFDWEECEGFVSFPLRGLVPFDGDGNWHLCLDYRERPRGPAVTFIDIECDEQAAVTDSFEEYLSVLRIDVDDEYVLDVHDLEQAIKGLSRTLGVRFDPPDSWAHGYPVHRAGLGTTSRPEWIWISPNKVPAGFVRVDDARYDELKDGMREMS